MITIFTCPKPFTGQTKVHQYNAIRSWKALSPDGEIFLCADGEGVHEAAESLDVTHIPDVDVNEFGTPLLNSIFRAATDAAAHPVTCFVNCDIILLSDFAEAVHRISNSKLSDRFLMVGQRHDVDTNMDYDFGDPRCEARLRAVAQDTGTLSTPYGIDYFAFPRGVFSDLPPFAVGRPGWDNWMIWRARSEGIPIVDATKHVLAIHQNHDYNHVPCRSGARWQGPEGDRNAELAGPQSRDFNIHDATWVLTPGGVRWAAARHPRRRVSASKVLHPRLYACLEPGIRLVRAMEVLMGGLRGRRRTG